MTIKKSKPGHKCSYCGEAAVWHNFWARAGTNACEKHKPEIDIKSDDGHMSEGDYSSWGRLR